MFTQKVREILDTIYEASGKYATTGVKNMTDSQYQGLVEELQTYASHEDWDNYPEIGAIVTSPIWTIN